MRMVDRSPVPRLSVPVPRRALPVLRRALPAIAVVTALTVTGCGTTDGAGPTSTGTASQPVTAPAVTGSGKVAVPPSSAATRTIPSTAFFEMPGNMRRERRPAEGSAAVPELCDRELAAGDGVVASAAMMSLYKQPDDPAGSVPQGVLYQTIRAYSGDAAAAFLDRARDGLAECDSYRNGETTVTVRTKPLPGVADEALTIDLVQPQLDLPGNPTGGEQANRVVVMRFGTTVTVLYDSEYERSSSIPELVDTFIEEAAKAIRAWRG
jgi:hypothetical protein